MTVVDLAVMSPAAAVSVVVVAVAAVVVVVAVNVAEVGSAWFSQSEHCIYCAVPA